MLKKPIIHEFDYNSIFLRDRHIEIHQKKLNQIKKRKNQFNMYNSESEFFPKRKQSPLNNIEHGKNYFIDRDNRYLCEKLTKISSSTNVFLITYLL